MCGSPELRATPSRAFSLSRIHAVGDWEHMPPVCGLRRPAANFLLPDRITKRRGMSGKARPTAGRRRQDAGRVRSPLPTELLRLRDALGLVDLEWRQVRYSLFRCAEWIV